MKALIELYEDIVSIYGYETEICSALHQWQQYLRTMQGKEQSKRLFFGKSEPHGADAKYQYMRTFKYLIEASSKNGINSQINRRGIIALTYAVWEERYRERIACECGLTKKGVQSDVFHDLNKYRQAILHAGGRLDAKPKVLTFFKLGDEVLLTDRHMYELFKLLVEELNNIGLTYYGRDLKLNLDKQLYPS